MPRLGLVDHQRRIQEYSWHIARLPFKQAIGHALKDRSTTQSIILRVVDGSGLVGYGEGAPRSYIAQESINDIGPKLETLLKQHPLPEIMSWDDINAYSSMLRAITNYPSIVCAVETALLDLFGQQIGCHINNALPGMVTEELAYSMVIPFMSLEAAKRYVTYAKQLAIRHLKIKVGFEEDQEFIQQLLEDVPPEMEVRLDANQSWSFSEAVKKCAAFWGMGIRYIEEPLAKSEVDQLPQLSRKVDVKLGLDESLFTLDQAKFYGQNMAVDSVYFNLKLSKCGGYFGTHKIWRFAQTHGIPCQLGCNVGETAILSALGRSFAQQHHLLFTEGSFNNLLLEEDLTNEKLSFSLNGSAPRLDLPGVGIEIKPNHPIFDK